MEFTDEIIGARLIETITAGLYDGNLNCIREYIQNSIDAGSKNIEVYFENGNKNLVILDDGSGMDENGLKNALSLGKSTKNSSQIGWRGIGIWSGVSACMKIVIITKMKNKPKYRIQIDNDILRTANRSNEPILKILSKSTSEISEKPLGKDESENSHFTMVRLETILPTQDHLFIDEEVRNYLSKIVPAPFNLSKMPTLTEVDKWLKQKKITSTCPEIRLNEEKIYRPPYSATKYYDAIIYHDFIVKGKLLAVGWFLMTREYGELKWPDGGIFFKKKGMTIGDENLIKSFFKGKYNSWQYGEIHIVSDDIHENAGRNGFEYNNVDFRPFLEDINQFIANLQNVNRYKGEVVKLRTYNKISNDFNKGKITTTKKELDSVLKSYEKSRTFPSEKSLQSIKISIDNHGKEVKSQFEEMRETISTTTEEIQAQLIKEQEEELRKMISSLPKPVQKSMKQRKGDGLLHPVITFADAIEELLKKKTKQNPDSFVHLTRLAYGWGDVTGSKKEALLTVHPDFAKNRRFGAMLYAFYDLIINEYKHEKGNDSLNWLEQTSREERLKVTREVLAVMGLLYRLVEFSEPVDKK
jgi:hypothetical protein